MPHDPKLLMKLHEADMQVLNSAEHCETGMGLHVVFVSEGPIAILSDGSALPCFRSPRFYDLGDLNRGDPAPLSTQPNSHLPSAYQVAANRRIASAAIAAVGSAPSSPTSGPATGASPLLIRRTLLTSQKFLRYISSPVDPRFASGNLRSGTYLTTRLERRTASSGFAAVGRFALPLPVPACRVIEYELPDTTVIDAGTVAPLFGQSGGGVEICVVSSPSAVQVRATTVPEY